MALKKLITIQSDPFVSALIGEYWVITKMESDKRDNRTRVEISLYENQEKSKPENGSDIGFTPMPLYKMYHVIDGMDVTREDAYIELKKLPQFNDAEDC